MAVSTMYQCNTCLRIHDNENPCAGLRLVQLERAHLWRTQWLDALARNLRDAAALTRASNTAANLVMRRLLHHLTHDDKAQGHRGTRYMLAAMVRTWWYSDRQREFVRRLSPGWTSESGQR